MEESRRQMFLLCVWTFLTAVRAVAADDVAAKVDAFIRAEMTRQKIPGLGIAILQRGEVTLAKGYGFANVEHDVPVTTDTIFQSGSVGKQFTAALVLLLAEEGQLALSDPLTSFIPNTAPEWAGITLRHLLTHTSGISDYTTEEFDPQKNYSAEDLLASRWP